MLKPISRVAIWRPTWGVFLRIEQLFTTSWWLVHWKLPCY